MTKREKLIEIIDAGDPNAKPPEAILDALLAELREPDEGMVRAAWKAANELTWGPEEYVSHEMCKVAHAAMIDHILSPAPTPKEEVA